MVWRRDRDSNPGDGFPPTHFPGVRLRPLGHLSVARFLDAGPGDLQEAVFRDAVMIVSFPQFPDTQAG